MLTEGRVAAALLLGVLLTATVVALCVLVHQWRHGRSLLTGRQVVLRLLGGGTLFLIWLMIGAMLLSIRPLERPQAFLLCFYATLLCSVLLAILAIVDLRWLRVSQRRERERLSADFIRLHTATTERRHGR